MIRKIIADHFFSRGENFGKYLIYQLLFYFLSENIIFFRHECLLVTLARLLFIFSLSFPEGLVSMVTKQKCVGVRLAIQRSMQYMECLFSVNINDDQAFLRQICIAEDELWNCFACFLNQVEWQLFFVLVVLSSFLLQFPL